LRVPILAEGKVIGSIGLDNVDREHAFDEAAVRLLTTLASSMSMAMERARLFEQTKSLLAQTEQRADELATINALGQALSSKIELDELIRTVGEKMREMFRADVVYVALLDEAAGAIRFPYAYGDDFTPLALGEGLTGKIIETGDRRDAGRCAGQVLPGRADHGARQGDRRHQRPKHPRGRPLYAGRPEPAHHDGHRRRRRDSQCAALRRGPRRPRTGRDRQRGQERFPRDDEPRDPHADECGHRHEGPPARHAALARAVRLCDD